MGYLEICKSDKLVKYGSTKEGCGCDCVSKNDPAFIYTDGCLYQPTGQGGYGVFSKGLNINISNWYPYEEHKNMVAIIEMKAILQAIKEAKLHHSSQLRIDIFSDCEFALAHLVNLAKGEEAAESYNNLGAAILKEVNDVQAWTTKVFLHKVKAHSGIQGNEMADQYAKRGAKRAPQLKLAPQTPPPLSSLHCSRQQNDEFYSKTPASFSSCGKKRSRVSQTPSNNRIPKRPSASPAQAPAPAPSPCPKRRASPHPYPPPSSGHIRKKQPVDSTEPRNHPYNNVDPKPFPPSSSSKKPAPRGSSSEFWRRRDGAS